MNGSNGDNPGSDVLIGRIIDGEATESDRAAFERLASLDPSLWQALALRQQEMMLLADRVRAATEVAQRVDLPGPRSRLRLRPGSAWRAAMLCSGWAAVLVFAAAWWFDRLPPPGSPGRAAEPARTRDLSSLPPERLLEAYLQADFVVGEMTPTLLGVEERPDGRLRLRYLRRVEEWVDVAPPPPVDEQQALTARPEDLRRLSPQTPPRRRD
jgi:hypothetical protein